MENTRILITGGAGPTGSHIATHIEIRWAFKSPADANEGFKNRRSLQCCTLETSLYLLLPFLFSVL